MCVREGGGRLMGCPRISWRWRGNAKCCLDLKTMNAEYLFVICLEYYTRLHIYLNIFQGVSN